MASPPTRYARSGEADIAYKLYGEGPRDIVVSPAFVSHLDMFWELPENADFVERLSELGRVILIEKRGTGLSERQLSGVTAEVWSDDIVAVLDAVGSSQAVLFGWLDTGAVSLLTAARHPDRVSAVVASEVLAPRHAEEDPDVTVDPDVMEALAVSIETGSWGDGAFLRSIVPDVAQSDRLLTWWSRYETMSATPSGAAKVLRIAADLDLRPWLERIRAPVLLVHLDDFELVSGGSTRWIADRVPDANMRVIHDEGPRWTFFPLDDVLDEMEEFIAGTQVTRGTHRQLVALLVTDIVGSSETAATGGDVPWRVLLNGHRAVVRRSLARFGGTEIDTAGDGFLVTFELPSAALRCAQSVVRESRDLGIEVRAGVHAGEVIVQASNVIGLAVHVAARVAAVAGPSEVLVSDTVRTLLLASGVDFETVGEHSLKGVPGTWELFRVVPD